MVMYWLLLTTTLCLAYGQHVDQYCNTFEIEHKIIDIKSSVGHGATLLNGTYKETLGSCVLACCDMEECDLAVYRNEGTSLSNRNCYLIHCGDFDNCKLVNHTNFTAISLSDTNNEEATTLNITTTPTVVNPTILIPSDELNVTESTAIAPASTVTIPLTAVPDESTTSYSPATRSPTPIPSSSSYTTASHISSSSELYSTTGTMSSSSTVMPAPTSVVKSDVSANSKPAPTNLGGSGLTEEPSDDDHRLCGNANCSKSKVAGLLVACVLVAVLLAIVILVVVKKSWDRHRHKKYRKIDYLIDGMYS